MSKTDLPWSLSGERIELGGGVPVSVRFILMAWFAVTVYLAWVVLSLAFRVGPAPLAALYALLLALGAGSSYAAWFWTDRLTLIPSARAYVWERGIYPFARRRQGDLEEFHHVALLPKRGHTRNGQYFYWHLALSWREGEKAKGKSPEYAISGTQNCSDGVEASVLAENLARRLGLPLKTEPVTESAAGRWALTAFAALFVGVIVWVNIYNEYDARGPRFPVNPGRTTVINHRIDDFLVRSFQVTQGPSYSEFVAGDHPYTAIRAQYTLVLDIRNMGAKASHLPLVIGFGDKAGHTRTEADTGQLPPGESGQVTVSLSWSEQCPNDLFLRKAD